MQILPFEKYTISSSKSLKQLHKAIDENCEVRRLLIDPNQELKSFFGSRRENEFELTRATIKKNSFAPLAIGKITKANKQTTIDIVLRLSWPVIIFTSIWVMFFIASSIIFLFVEKSIMGLVPAAMLFFGFRLMRKSISTELTEMKKSLKVLTD